MNKSLIFLVFSLRKFYYCSRFLAFNQRLNLFVHGELISLLSRCRPFYETTVRRIILSIEWNSISESFCLSVVISVYNEEKTLEKLVHTVAAVPIRKQIILINDCSKDASKNVMEKLAKEFQDNTHNSILLLEHDKSQGKGAALRTGFAHATGDVILIQDAGLEYNPAEYPFPLAPILKKSRYRLWKPICRIWCSSCFLYYWHSVGNQFLTTLSNFFTDLNLTDMETCYKVFRPDVIQDILPKLRQNRFGFEPEITAHIAKSGYRIYEIGISYDGRTYKESKKIGWKDGFRAIWCILRYNLFK